MQTASPVDLLEEALEERCVWHAEWILEKWDDCIDADAIAEAKARGEVPDEIVTISGNLLMYGGASCLWQCLTGNGTGTAAQTLTYFNNAQAAIGVGDSSASAVATQTDLQASSNKLRVAMNATYPVQTDGVTSAANTITFQSTFGNSQANYAWNEVGIFNSASAGIGRMLNRLAQTFGTKSSGSWSMSVAITLA